MSESEGLHSKAKFIIHKKLHLKSLDKILSETEIKKVKSENFKEINTLLFNPIFNKTELGKTRLIKANQKLILKYANRYYRLYKNKLRAIDIDDLVSAGNLGLVKAIKKFDSKYKNSFSTYAVFWIKQAILREIKENLGITKIPESFLKKINRYNSDHTTLSEQDKNIVNLVNYRFNDYTSLDEFINNGNGNLDTCKKDLIASSNIYTPNNITHHYKTEYTMERKEFIERIKKVLSSQAKQRRLTTRHLKIFMLRYGLEDGIPKSLEEVGDEIGVTRERVRQICEKCLNKLKQSKQFSLEDYSTFEANYDKRY
ncbi:sigma-70 region 2 [Treponema socranskii subsp. socranskii VPI DR56BR1116 = ATCC 35536]|uniref:Sigma-70 region 2 n=1 Tax=Treponema socranskii subsp. socranskii VPI DR56BR1116 = ATCC 35536 TaxID=1125725 RepID=U1FPN2_TRESO|nr:sigma-70 family RNA polymerase sigma factor [Treponema socranskii]ERF61853.1 sigma-70 region 2 [Treponema socranskii subsp. socranskii VPI DR56BR1116 = ATCC 35536]ERK00459.1 sigma-70 region 2 [Treponema socranskii subsp. socranskii VPI DR56BR1116 = ATCC 35536]